MFSQDPASSSNRLTVSPAVIVVALVLAPVTAYWTVDQAVDAVFSLLVPPLIMTMLVALANLAVRRVAPRWSLSESDLVLFYGTHAVVSAICAEWMRYISPHIYSFALFHRDNPAFVRYIVPYTHPWFYIQPKDAGKFTDFVNGGFGFRHFVRKLPLWWVYIAAWTCFVTLVLLAMQCVNSLMRIQWTRRERLAFPLIQLPVAIARTGAGHTPIWRNRFFLAAFIVMFSIDMLNGIHFYYPNTPLINVRFLADASQWTPNPPFNAIGWTPVGIFPYLSAIGFFMPADLLFSCVFFFFARKATQIAAYALGYIGSAGMFGGGYLVPGPPYFSEQAWGAFLALFVAAAWVARGYLRGTWQAIVRGGPATGGGVSERFSFALLLLCLACLMGIARLIGVPLWMALFELLFFLIFSIALTRLRAQIGAPTHEMAFMGPNQLLVDAVGTQALPPADISRVITTFYVFNRIHRTHPMPQQLEAMKMADTARAGQRTLFAGLAVAAVTGSVLGHLIHIYLGYRYGAAVHGFDTAAAASQLMSARRPPNPTAMFFILFGFAFALALDFIRIRFPGFPLHPVGFALAMNFGLDYYWFGLLIVLLVKLFVERFWGLRGHDRLRQVALGIILAEFCAEAIWAAVQIATGAATYTISIGSRVAWME